MTRLCFDVLPENFCGQYAIPSIPVITVGILFFLTLILTAGMGYVSVIVLGWSVLTMGLNMVMKRQVAWTDAHMKKTMLQRMGGADGG